MPFYEPIKFVKLQGQGGMPAVLRAPEAATQTMKIGTPIELTSGYAQEANFGGTELVYGVSMEAGHNLAVAGTAQQSSEGTPQNQPSAVTTPVGAWMRDGKLGIYLANGVNVFSAMLLDGGVFVQSLVSSTRYALVKDGTTGFWYVDNTSSGTNDEHAVNILAVDPSSPNSATLGARVWFMFAPAARYFD